MRALRWPSVAAALLASAGIGSCSGVRVHGEQARWRSAFEREHPLVGVIYDVGKEAVVTLPELSRALVRADIVLLGEQHDNLDHHLLQAELLRQMVSDGRRPVVAFEQIDVEDQQKVDSAVASQRAAPVSGRATAISEALLWEKSGWPPFDQYRPVFEVALSAELPLRAANLSRKRAYSGSDLPPQSRALRSARPLDPLAPGARKSLEEDVLESHCGYAPSEMLRVMVEAQSRRDRTMADAVAAALEQEPLQSQGSGALLICGFGHARNDYGVPLALAQLLPQRSLVSVALLEVIPGVTGPRDYAALLHAARLPFDYVVFTPRASNEDPCEKFRAGLEKMKQH